MLELKRRVNIFMISIAVVNFQDYIYTRTMVSISKSISFLRIVACAMKLY